MEQIFQAYGLSKETVTVIMMFYKNTKVMLRPPDSDTDFFDVVAGVFQGDTLASYMFIICLDYELRTSIDLKKKKKKKKKKGLIFKNTRSWPYPAETMTADYADELALPSNTTDQAESLLFSL